MQYMVVIFVFSLKVEGSRDNELRSPSVV
jgi:hypothetical protein